MLLDIKKQKTINTPSPVLVTSKEQSEKGFESLETYWTAKSCCSVAGPRVLDCELQRPKCV